MPSFVRAAGDLTAPTNASVRVAGDPVVLTNRLPLLRHCRCGWCAGTWEAHSRGAQSPAVPIVLDLVHIQISFHVVNCDRAPRYRDVVSIMNGEAINMRIFTMVVEKWTVHESQSDG